MRFEVFLTQLPRAAPARVKATLAEMPKGVSTGVILKTLETRQVPTVPVAWSDDKRDMNEVVDTLVDLGAECRLVDHGNLFLRIGTMVAERFGAARYHEDDEDAAPRVYKLGGDASESTAEKLTRHALTYALEALAACVLFAWTVGLRLGMAGLSLQVLPELVACALGTLAAYGIANCAVALRSGHLEWKQALPVFVVAGAFTLVSPFLLGSSSGFGATGESARISRPPSLPYSGLLVELQRRKLAAELAGTAHQAEALEGEAAAALRAERAAREAALSCMAEAPRAELLACQLERWWEDAAACLPLPASAAQPVLDATPLAWSPDEGAGLQSIAPFAAAPFAPSPAAVETTRAAAPRVAAAAVGKAGLNVTFALVDVLWLMASCLGILVGVSWYERRRSPKGDGVTNSEPALAADAAPPVVEAAPVPGPDPKLAIAALEASHAQALSALEERHQADLAALHAKLEATEAERRKLQDDTSRKLEDQRKFEQDAARYASELARAQARAARAEAEANELRALNAARPKPANEANAQGPTTGLNSMPKSTLAEDSSAYSVSSGQEERVVLPRRKR